MLFGSILAEKEVGVKFLEIFKDRIGAYIQTFRGATWGMPSPFNNNICAVLTLQNSMVHIELW